MWFREDIDKVITGLNMTLSPDKPIPTTMELMLKHTDDLVSFGGASALTGLDLSSKFSQATGTPDDAWSALFPYSSDIYRKVTSVGKAIANPSKATGLAALHANVPTAFKGPVEHLGASNPTIGPNLAKDEANFIRTPSDWVARDLGGRSLREARIMQERRQYEMGESLREQKRASIIEKAKMNPNNRAELKREYINASDNKFAAERKFTAAMEEHAKNKALTPEQRLGLKSMNNPQAVRRRKELEGSK